LTANEELVEASKVIRTRMHPYNMNPASERWPDSGKRAFKSYLPPELKVYGCICITKDNKILLVKGKRSQKWSFPKGHKERCDRSSLDCALRELKEETGLVLDDKYISVKKYKAAEYYIYSISEENRLFPVDNDEIEDAQWIPYNKIKQLDKNVDVSMFCHHIEDKVLNSEIMV
jgi:8-oxo-dGTP pyrophosphatase MutT (NUDIX family)